MYKCASIILRLLGAGLTQGQDLRLGGLFSDGMVLQGGKYLARNWFYTPVEKKIAEKSKNSKEYPTFKSYDESPKLKYINIFFLKS